MDGFAIPIDGDLSGLQASLDAIPEAISRMGAQIAAALAQANGATQAAVSAMNGFAAANVKANAAVTQGTTKTAGFISKFVSFAEAAGKVAGAVNNITTTINSFGAITEAITKSVNAIRDFRNAVKEGGIRKALDGLRTNLKEMTKDQSFRVLAVKAITAGVAIAGVTIAVKATHAVMATLRKIGTGTMDAIRSAADRVKGGFKSVFSLGGGGGAGGVKSMFGPMLGMIGAGGLLYTAIGQFREAWDSAAVFEDMQVQVEQFTGSAAKAQAVLADMTSFGAKTPFEMPDINESLVKLLPGLKDEAGGLVKELGAVAANGQQLTELSDAMAKGFAKGKFQTEELNKFLERGINLMPELEAVTGKTGDALRKAIEDGLQFDDVRSAIARLSAEGGTFFGMLERRSRTTSGIVSNLVDVWNLVRRSFMQPIQDALKPVLLGATDALAGLVEAAAAVGKQIGNALVGSFAVIKSGRTGELLSAGFGLAIAKGLDVLDRGFKGAVAFLSTALPPVFDAITAKLYDARFWEGVKSLFDAIASKISAAFQFGPDFANARQANEDAAASSFKAAEGLFRHAGGIDMGKAIADGLSAGMKAAKDAAQGPESQGVIDAKANWRNLMDSVKPLVQQLQKVSSVPPPPIAKPREDMTNSPALGGGALRQTLVIASSLARVGGEDGGMVLSKTEAEQRRTNTLLARSNSTLSKIHESLRSRPQNSVWA